MAQRSAAAFEDGAVDGSGVDLLGRLVVRGTGRLHEVSAITRHGRVLSMLVSRCNERVAVDELAEAVWPHRRPASYRKSLQVSVVALRDLFDPGRTSRTVRRSPIVAHTDSYELRLDAHQIDAVRFESLVRSGLRLVARGEAMGAASAFRAALALWGEPLVGTDIIGVQPYVERLRMSRREAQTGLIEAEVLLGIEDLSDIERAVAAEPYDERRWGHLMIALFRRGRQSEALAAFTRVRALLVDELGLEPGQYLRRIEEQILLQDPALLGAHDAVAPGHLAPRWPEVPSRAGPLLHRDDELRTIRTVLLSWRAVTVTGPPGVGKTTLAIEVARAHPCGDVAWLSLGDVAAGPGVSVEIARRLGVASELPADPSEFRRLLAARLGDRDMLLVLDNVEHLADDVVATVTELLRSCPGLTVLMTSRRPVGLASERVYRVEALGPAGVDYLTDRAGLGAVDETARAALVRISEHVGGLPLGLEQVADRLRSMTAVELASRLELLTETGEGLERAVAWSLDLLPSGARVLLDALCFLEAPWSLARAEAVGAQLGLGRDAVDRAVSVLVEHSLTVDAPDAGPVPLRRLIEPVRHLLRAIASSSADSDRSVGACARAVLAEARAAARDIEGADQARGMATLRSLMPDIRRTIIWCAESHEPRIAAELLAELRAWWWCSGLYADGQSLHHIAGTMVEEWKPSDSGGHGWRLRALSTQVVTRPGFSPAATHAPSLHTWLAEARSVSAGPAVESWIAQLLSCGLSFTNRDNGAAERLAIQAIDSAVAANDPWLSAWGRYALALARARVDPIASLEHFEQAISAFVAAGDQLNAARVTMFLGHGSRIFGDARSSDVAFARAEQWCAQLGAAPVTRLDCQLGRAQSADAAGRFDEAAVQYRALIPRLRELGDHRCAAVAQRNLAAILAAEGDLDGASALVAHAQLTLETHGDEEAELAVTFLVRAQIAEARQQPGLAARLLGRARLLASGTGVPIEVRDVQRMADLGVRLAQCLGNEAFERLVSSGQEDRWL